MRLVLGKSVLYSFAKYPSDAEVEYIPHTEDMYIIVAKAF